MRCMRVMLWFTSVGLGLGLLSARAVHARGREMASALAEPLDRAMRDAAGGGTTLSLNGQKLNVASAHVDAKVHAVLDRAQMACESHADGLSDDLAAIESSFARSPSERGVPGVGVLRDEREGRGVVTCFATGVVTDYPALWKRVARFSESHDLADIGALRYIAAHEEDTGTRVVATWTDERLDLDQLFPDATDAPGDDPTVAPRPEHATRFLSVRVEPAAPYGVFMYTVPERRGQSLVAYDRAMKEKGFESLPLEGTTQRTYKRGGVDVFVSAVEHEDGTTIAIVESSHTWAAAGGGASR
jgi:hypothetical protein